METKPKLLCLAKIFVTKTDENHPLSTNQLIEMLKSDYGLSVHRTTIPRDIDVLKKFGMDIISVRSTQTKFFLGQRTFEIPELKLLIDAVESSKFITKKKSDELIKKIYTLASENQVKRLKRNNYVPNRVKPDNEQIYYIVDAINDAINLKKKISFQYYEYIRLKKKALKNEGEVYVISPYHLVWSGDYYYVIGYSDKREQLVCFRVDRIAVIPVILGESAVKKPSGFNLDESLRSVFSMYSGETEVVDLKCKNKLMKTMIDRFGDNVKTYVYDDESFHIITKVEVSNTFFGWVFGFGGDVKILGPENVKSQYKEMLECGISGF